MIRFTAAPVMTCFNGEGGTDTAFYSDATSGVTVSLAISGAQNTGGAGTDTLSTIENLYGSGLRIPLRAIQETTPFGATLAMTRFAAGPAMTRFTAGPASTHCMARLAPISSSSRQAGQ